MKKRMVIDTANLLFRVAAVNSKFNQGTPEEKAGLAMHMSLNVINKFFKAIRPEQIAVTFEGHSNWRKKYTMSEECLSQRKYKANRVKDPSMIPFFELIAGFEDMVRNHTSMVCLQHPECEGDDMVAAFCQYYPDDQIYVVSGDSDFNQLLRYPNVDILKPDSTTPFRANNADFDPEYFIFEKCFRGDKKDNVFPAYPRVRAEKIKKAFTDEYARNELFKTELEFLDDNGNKVKHVVGDLWLENKLLLDLECQPEEIRIKMMETVKKETEQHGKFNLFYFQKFLGKYQLKQIADNVTQYIDLFSVTYKNSEHKDTQEVTKGGENRKNVKQLISF